VRIIGTDLKSRRLGALASRRITALNCPASWGMSAEANASSALAVRPMTRPIALAANPKPRVWSAVRRPVMIAIAKPSKSAAEHFLPSAAAYVAAPVPHFISPEMVHLIETL
jgi:hypothetical protein